MMAHYGVIKAMLRFLFGDAAEARRVTEAIRPPPGVVFKVDYVFYHGMACAELARAAEPLEREELLAKAEADLARFEPWRSRLNGQFLGAPAAAERRAARSPRATGRCARGLRARGGGGRGCGSATSPGAWPTNAWGAFSCVPTASTSHSSVSTPRRANTSCGARRARSPSWAASSLGCTPSRRLVITTALLRP